MGIRYFVQIIHYLLYNNNVVKKNNEGVIYLAIFKRSIYQFEGTRYYRYTYSSFSFFINYLC